LKSLDFWRNRRFAPKPYPCQPPNSGPETICDRLVNGESLRAISSAPDAGQAAVFRWLASNQEFRRPYAFAR
jgi:hypothetical protein